MTRLSLVASITLITSLLALAALAQQKPADNAALDSVLKKMDSVAAAFSTAQADFEWDRYERAIAEVDDVQKGTIFYRREGKQVEMMADVKMAGDSAATLKADPKYVLFSGDKIRVYQPGIDQEVVYDLGKSHSDFESYLVLGFGGSGDDLQKAFDVTYGGPETIQGVATAKLDLTPKSLRVRNNFTRILLWIDLAKGVSVQQQFFDPQGDYRLTKYSEIRLNGPISKDVFKLKTSDKTQIVSPRG
ncbi:MAG TPA: outer membrane lipoprotein carrier protein LolA [Verrucomicrobiae bacterium]|nr:outer membrane lipoprotein carrier protein LolA [Verrucomicrobiae bacterium]